jgi:hypothetical protein
MEYKRYAGAHALYYYPDYLCDLLVFSLVKSPTPW